MIRTDNPHIRGGLNIHWSEPDELGHYTVHARVNLGGVGTDPNVMVQLGLMDGFPDDPKFRSAVESMLVARLKEMLR